MKRLSVDDRLAKNKFDSDDETPHIIINLTWRCKMKKLSVLSAILVLSLGLFLAGCGNKSTTQQADHSNMDHSTMDHSKMPNN